jgi:hypothetical protein
VGKVTVRESGGEPIAETPVYIKNKRKKAAAYFDGGFCPACTPVLCWCSSSWLLNCWPHTSHLFGSDACEDILIFSFEL